ncbi:MAG TPA: hypothetical protein VF403_03005, partial [Kofleriaceae bacterium]
APVVVVLPPVATPTTAPPPRQRWIVPVAGVVVVAASVLAIKSLSSSSRAVLQQDAAIVVAPVLQPDAAIAIVPAVVVDAAVALADAPGVDGGQLAELPKHPKKPPTVITPPVPLHTVIVNAKPWAYFTVDDNPAQYQTPDTLHLAAGPHTVHFTHGTVTRATAITVPDSDALTVLEDMSH